HVLPRHTLFFISCLFFLKAPYAQEPGKVLTLEAALASVASAHPDLQLVQAERDSANAERDIAASRLDSSINFEGILRSGSRSNALQEFAPDNSVRLTARKTLYDFGRSNAAEQAGYAELKAREADMITARDRRRLEVMSRYFEVLIADMQFTADNEMMAVIFVGFDHGKENFSAGKISAIELAELETRYQDILLKRTASAQRQRITRALLANAMNRPGDLPGDLQDPKLEGNERVLPEYESLLSILLANNPRLLAQQEMLAASQQRLEALRAEKGPQLDAEVQAADYSRSAVTRDNLSAGLILTWPLYQGNRTDARMAKELAQINKLQAGSEKLKMELTQAMLETWLEIAQLKNAARSVAKKYADYRDMVLERSRGLYELELKSNLGTAMADTVEASLRTRRTEYLLALAFVRLEALLGKPLAGQKTELAEGQ
ncbi:MAG: TolC family protein, partial [Gallionellaceae bacterium]|nr:TolC family protein [Gallionellaceae bacterium]